MKKRELLNIAKTIYGTAKKITKKMLENIKFRINRIKARLGIPVVTLRSCKPRCHISK